jgi:hypothetical protein
MTGQHGEPGLGRPPGQLGDQARLADAGLARDDREARLAFGGPLKQCGQRRDLLAPPDEDRALHRLAHNVHGATGVTGEGNRGQAPWPVQGRAMSSMGTPATVSPPATRRNI